MDENTRQFFDPKTEKQIFETRDGRTIGSHRKEPLKEPKEPPKEPRDWKVEDLSGQRHLSRVADAVERALAPPDSRLEALARLLVELPYGEFVEMAGGIAAQAAQVENDEMPPRFSSDLARLIHAWAVQTLHPLQGLER
jgi:hypothetical protein